MFFWLTPNRKLLVFSAKLKQIWGKEPITFKQLHIGIEKHVSYVCRIKFCIQINENSIPFKRKSSKLIKCDRQLRLVCRYLRKFKTIIKLHPNSLFGKPNTIFQYLIDKQWTRGVTLSYAFLQRYWFRKVLIY